MIQFSYDKCLLFDQFKHHLCDNSKAHSINQVVENLIGLHAARLITPYATLATRIEGFIADQLTDELYETKTLIKMRCMRKTLHIVNYELAPIVHNATLKLRVADCLGYYRKEKISQYSIDTIKEHILVTLSGTERKSSDIEKYVLSKTYDHSSKTIRVVLKELWEKGILCYVNKSDHWSREQRYYSIMGNYHPDLKLDSISVEEAQDKLIFLHIKKYGPVTERDCAWWSGLPYYVVRRSIRRHKKHIEEVTIKGSESVFYMHKSDVESFIDLSLSDKHTVYFYAHEDPSLKGYYESRRRYIKDDRYNDLFNSIGESRSSFMVEGNMQGLWSWDKKSESIFITKFSGEKVSSAYNSLLEEKINIIEKSLNNSF